MNPANPTPPDIPTRRGPSCRSDRPNFVVWWYAGNVLLLVLIALVPVWIKTVLHLHHNYDLGIFSQALASIQINDLNPFLPALDIPLFNDHFDPILICFAPLAKIVEPAYAALLVEHLLILLSPLPLFLLCRKQPGQAAFLCLATTYLLFNRGMLSALAFPVHPTTWSTFFVVVCGGLAVTRRHFPLLVLSSLLLMACKEEFPFVVLMIGAGHFLGGRRKQGALLVVLSLVWTGVAFGVRPLFMDGRTNSYAARILMPLLSDPIATIGARLLQVGEAKRFFQCLIPLIPAGYWLAKKRTAPHLTLWLALLPLLGIRFIDGAWQFHYLAPVPPLLLLATWRPDQAGLPRRYAIVGIVLVLLAGANPIRKSVASYGLVDQLGGPRHASIEQARARLLSDPAGDVLVEGNLTPLLAKRGGVYQIGGVQSAREYRFLLAEKPPQGGPWPLTHADIEQIIVQWRNNPHVAILQDDAHLFFAQTTPTPEGRPSVGESIPPSPDSTGITAAD